MNASTYVIKALIRHVSLIIPYVEIDTSDTKARNALRLLKKELDELKRKNAQNEK